MARLYSPRRGRIGSSGQVASARADVYAAGAEILLGIDRELKQEEQANQLSKANVASIAEWGASENWFRDNADKPDTFVNYIAEGKDKRWEAISKDITNPDVLSAMSDDFEARHAKELVRAEERADLQRATNIRTDHGIALDELGKPRLYKDELDLNAHVEEIHTEVSLRANLYTDKGAETQKRQLTEMAVSSFVIQAVQGQGETEAYESIDGINEKAKELGYGGDMFDPEEIEGLKKDYRAQKNATDRVAKLELEATQYQNDVNLYLRMPENDPEQKTPVTITELNEMLRTNNITKATHESLKKQMVGKPEDIVTDQRVMTELEKDAYNVSNGSVTIDELRESARKARYDDKIIDDDAYHAVVSLANRKHETYQANAMGEAITYARFQLLAEDEVLYQIASEADLIGDETVAKKIVSLGRLQNENYSQYKRALDEWFESEKAAGREPDDDDIYIKSRKMLAHYRQRVLDESIYEDLRTKEELKTAELGKFFKTRPRTVAKFKGEKPLGSFGLRPDGTKKGNGYLGVLSLPNGGVTTEYTVQSNAVKIDGKRIDFPTLVPTLTQKEVDLMVNDIIPNGGDIPEEIMQKAIKHAKKRIKEGKSVFADEKNISEMSDEELRAIIKGK